MAANPDYVMTIDSDCDDFPPPVLADTPTMKSNTEDGDLNPEFTFDISGDPYIDAIGYDADLEAPVQKGSKPVSP
jgi:ATP-dependent RNA helicase DDX27